VAVGSRVRVALHGRRVGAWVVEDGVTDPPTGVTLSPLLGVSGLGPPPDLLDVADWAAWRWAGPRSTLLRAASPDHNVWSLPPVPAALGPGDVERLRRAVPADGPAWDDLVSLVAAGCDQGARGAAVVARLPPADDVLGVVLATVARGREGSVVVVVPSVGWADRLRQRLGRRGVPAAGTWEQAAAGWPVVVASRTGAWAPVPRLAAAVVLDAHDEAYASGWPAFHAVEVLAERARRAGAPCLLVSPCPPVALSEGRPRWAPPRTAEASGWPAVSVVDRRGADPRTGMFSEELVRVVRRTLDDAPRGIPVAGPVVCVLNRTGRARLLACSACGALARCAACGRAVEEVDGVLRCRGCGATRPVVCSACGATRLKALRQGVSRVREELAALLGVEVGEVAGPDRTGPLPDTPVVVGTEAVLHRVRRAAAVVFLDFDQHLLAPRHVAGEEALALLARAGRLAGPRRAPRGPVLVQCRAPDHPVVTAAVAGNPGPYEDEERSLRQRLHLPPTVALASLRGPGAGELAVAAAAAPAAAAGAPHGGPGLTSVPVADDRWLVSAPTHQMLCDALHAVPRPAERVSVTVDPVDV
jgi:primosomal protein N' (replication factor Y)